MAELLLYGALNSYFNPLMVLVYLHLSRPLAKIGIFLYDNAPGASVRVNLGLYLVFPPLLLSAWVMIDTAILGQLNHSIDHVNYLKPTTTWFLGIAAITGYFMFVCLFKGGLTVNATGFAAYPFFVISSAYILYNHFVWIWESVIPGVRL